MHLHQLLLLRFDQPPQRIRHPDLSLNSFDKAQRLPGVVFGLVSPTEGQGGVAELEQGVEQLQALAGIAQHGDRLLGQAVRLFVVATGEGGRREAPQDNPDRVGIGRLQAIR